MTTARIGAAAICLSGAVLAGGCRGEPPAPGPEHIPALAVDSAAAVAASVQQPGALATVQADPVVGWVGANGRPFEVARRTGGPDEGHARRFGSVTMSIVLRDQRPALTQYPCTTCHAGTRVTMAARRAPDVHHDIQPVHPDTGATICATCHAPENAELLVLMEGRRAPLDQSYRLCGQCHFVQADAWAGGGHGKRLDGWEGRRIVMSCTDCHDPHQPGVRPRIPFRAPVLERTRGGGHE